MSSTIQPSLLTRQQAGEYLGCSARTLRRWADRGAGPIFAKLGGGPRSKIKYAISDLNVWMSCGCPINFRDPPTVSPWGAPSRPRGADGRFVAGPKLTGDAS